MFLKRHHLFMASAAAMLSAGAAAVASAYQDDGKLRVRNVDSEQECIFDDRAQLDTFLASVEFPDAWELQGKPAGKAIEVDLQQLRADVAASTSAAPIEPAPVADPAPAPAADQATAPAVNEAPAATTETPAAAAPAAPKARKTTTKA